MDLPDDHARTLKDSCCYWVTSHGPSKARQLGRLRHANRAGSVMRTLRDLEYLYEIDCNKAYPVDIEVFKQVLIG